MSTLPSDIRDTISRHTDQLAVPADDAAEFATWLATTYELVAGGWQY